MQSRHTKQCTTREVSFTLMTQEKLYPNSYPISTFWSEDSPVSPSQSREQEKDLTIQEERCFLKLQELLPLKNLSISSSRMFPVCLTTTKAGHLKQSSIRWMSWGMMYAGRYNSKNFGVPQSRNRVYIIGYHRGQCAGEVLSFTQTSGKALIQRKANAR